MYHEECFVCHDCKQPFPDGAYVEVDGKAFCEECRKKARASGASAEPCAKCNQPLADPIVRALSTGWHKACFVCSSCSDPLGVASTYVSENSAFCEKCWKLRVCGVCGEMLPIGTTLTMEDEGQGYHRKCYKCTGCKLPFIGTKCEKKDGKPYCTSCFSKLK
eukprot:TRINITY_DN1031_c0_g1_i2.p1 TRINITY_DN1031_c0_g1~~TRINITY_DN1031_c0_g1_i2.p1  ORF type:complete len:187 (+),score=31.88 TRINITY_DN1031_c0_g1_i2:78-563(+)